jgi:uncharacterized protein (DUF983 family)
MDLGADSHYFLERRYADDLMCDPFCVRRVRAATMTHTHHHLSDHAIDPLAPRDTVQAMWRGASGKCPACGEGQLYRAYLKVADTCGHCGEELHHQRADDAPAYFTITIVGHIVVGGALVLERAFAPATWVHMALWLPLTLALSLALLPAVKGALIGLQWSKRMHGFSGIEDSPEPLPVAAGDSAAADAGGPR